MEEVEVLNKIYDYLMEKELIKSQRDFAKLIGESDSGYSDIKYGRKKLSLSHIRAIADNFNQINRDYLLLGKGDIENIQTAEPATYRGLSSLIESQKETIKSLKEINNLLREKILSLESKQ